MPAGLRRARRTAALARATAGALAVLIILTGVGPALTSTRTLLALAGFVIMAVTAGVQLRFPRADWVKVEESLAATSAVLIVGFGPERVDVLFMLWLVAIASGVLARGGRAGGVGRALLLISLALPIALHASAPVSYVCECLAVIALLLVCGRVTRELRTMLDRARHDADHDSLTGALARAAFRDALSRCASAAPGGVMLIDLDNFGAINKSAGHAAGDAVLQEIVGQMTGILGDSGFVGRLGGDEFAAVILDPQPDPIARRLLENVSAGRDAGLRLEASAGMAMFPGHGEDADSLLRAVDVALRVAKRSGRGQLSVYAGDPIATRGPGGAFDSLERLIGGEGLQIVVQPIVAVPERVVHAYEALARFQLGGNSSPLHWFSLADEFAVRDRLELACLRESLGLLHQLPVHAKLSVNLSAPLLLDPRTHQLLTEAGDLRGLIVELTENSLLEDTPGMHAQIAHWIGRGVEFAVDDMGAGYSGLSQITTLRPRYLKLDRSLITGVDHDPDRRALISAMLGYVQQTGGHLVAEGVETEVELNTLVEMGVRLIQGYLLGRPAPPWPTVSGGSPSTTAPRPAQLPVSA